jgi:hypothetical protein
VRRRIHCEKEDTFSAFAVFNDTVEGPRAQENMRHCARGCMDLACVLIVALHTHTHTHTHTNTQQ